MRTKRKNKAMRSFAQYILMFVLLTTISVSSLIGQHDTTTKKEIVVLLHGLGRGKSIMIPLRERLAKEGYDVRLVDYKSIGRTTDEILSDATAQINSFRNDSARSVHFVGHSLGGLLIRAYLDSIKVPNLGNVVLIGSPSKGTPFVDRFRDAWWLKLAGPIAVSLGTDEKSFPRTLREPYYPVGIIAGTTSTFDNEDFIPGDDDGIVPVESTKIEGMTDFILLNISHSSLPRHELVARKTIEFLKHGRFLKDKHTE